MILKIDKHIKHHPQLEPLYTQLYILILIIHIIGKLNSERSEQRRVTNAIISKSIFFSLKVIQKILYVDFTILQFIEVGKFWCKLI